MAIALLSSVLLWAQGENAAPPAAGGGGMWMQLFTFVLPLILLFYFFLILPQRREQRKRTEMIAAIKKNDRVVTVGGIYGVVTQVRAEADEVTLRIDESTNTKLRVTLGAIARVLGEDKSADESK